MPTRRVQAHGFTLLELLVVVAVIGLLLALLLPVVVGAKEPARRAGCQNHVRQFIIGLHVYGSENEEYLPSGLCDFQLDYRNSAGMWSAQGDGVAYNPAWDEHTPMVSRATYKQLVEVTGSEQVLRCPWLGKPFDVEGGWYHSSYGFVLGYNYLGGHEGTPWPLLGEANAQWISPQTLNADNTLPVITELNAWSTSEDKSIAPHGLNGPVVQAGDAGNSGLGGIPAADLGAGGGHLGMLDGSAQWKDISLMKVYRGSRQWDVVGCFTAW